MTLNIKFKIKVVGTIGWSSLFPLTFVEVIFLYTEKKFETLLHEDSLKHMSLILSVRLVFNIKSPWHDLYSKPPVSGFLAYSWESGDVVFGKKFIA